MDDAIARSSTMIRVVRRVGIEWLLWLPIWLLLTANMGVYGKFGMAVAVAFFFALGLGLHRMTVLWRRLTMIAIGGMLIAAGVIWFSNDLLAVTWMGILLWRGRYQRLTHLHYCLGFGICCAVLIVTSQSEAWADYRLMFILLALLWIIIWFMALNRGLVDDAGLHNGIVTRPVRQANRKYILVFLAAGMLIIAMTASYGQQLLTPKQVVNPNNSWIDPDRFIQPPQSMDKPEWMEGIEQPGKRWLFWDILFWVLLVVVICGTLWFIRFLWINRVWTWQGLLNSIRKWFLRENRPEKLPYLEESRSLRKEKKKGRFESLFRKHNRELEWERLSNPEKVRRLYEEAVLTGIEQGYKFKASDTPSETLDALEQWKTGGKAHNNEKKATYWSWLLQVHLSLLHLYEKAKYSPHEITSQDVRVLKENDTDRKGNR